MVNAPYDSIIRPSIWALSFSPDGNYVAAGIGFLKSPKAPYRDYRSYIALIPVAQSDSPARIFEVSAKPWSNGLRMTWGADGRYLAIDHVSLLEKNALVLDTQGGREYAIPRNNCSVIGVLPGPKLLLAGFFSQKIVRLVNLDGTADWEWPISRNTAGAGFALTRGWMALAVGDPSATGVNTFREFAIVAGADHSEIRRVPFSGSWGFSGAISPSGSLFCNQFYEPQAAALRTVSCQDLNEGREIGKFIITLGQRGSSTMLVSDAGRVAVQEGPVVPGSRSIWDVRSGKRLAHWSVPVQKVLPRSSWPAEYLNSKVIYPYALSPDGSRVAEAGAGVIVLYQLLE